MHNNSDIGEGLERPWLKHYQEGVPPTISPFEKPLFSFLDEAAARYPHRPAFIFQNTRLNYAELQIQAEKLAAALRLLGVNTGDRVAIMLPNLPQTIIAFWAVLKAGGVVVMTNPLYMETEILHHMNDSGAKHLILLDLLWPKIAPLRARLDVQKYIVTNIADALRFPLNWLYTFKSKRENLHNHHEHTFSKLTENDEGIVLWKNLFNVPRFSSPYAKMGDVLALIQYTGGTTGLPKGVMLTHGNLGTNALQIITALKKSAEEKHSFVALLPYFHVYGLSTGLIIPALLAATVLPTPRYVPQDILKLIKKFRPTIFPGAPAVYISLMQQKKLDSYHLDCIELCVSGSAPLSVEHFRKFQEITGAAIVEGYGLTEASPITHINPLQTTLQKISSIGIPLPGTDARIVDMEGGSLDVAPGKLGELIIRGPQIMQGYLNHPDESASALRNGWLYTGDLATMDENGYFYIVDRKKDMVIVAGYNVYPREVDEVLLEHPKIQEAVTVGITDSTRGETLKAFVVLHEGESMTRAEVTAWCRAKLAAYKLPRQVEFRESLPKTVVGKVLRRILRAEEDLHTEQQTTR
ncbi:MAG: long-chain fatty acid--CoA ligase [Desulfovibrionaceae bacterium]